MRILFAIHLPIQLIYIEYLIEFLHYLINDDYYSGYLYFGEETHRHVSQKFLKSALNVFDQKILYASIKLGKTIIKTHKIKKIKDI